MPGSYVKWRYIHPNVPGALVPTHTELRQALMSTSPGAGHVRNLLAPVTPLTQRLAIDPPEPLTRFVGRKAEVAAACALLQRPHVRLQTLTGPGGIGKTRLALVVATAMLANFPDGIAWAPLAAINDPALVLPAVAASVGIVASQPAGPIDQIQVALHDRRLLLLIDNVEQVVAAAADIARLLVACPTLTVLATSREPLHVSGEHILTVSPLDLPSLNDASPLEPQVQTGAVRLFAERATAASPDFRLDATTTPHVVRICQRLEGLPLAIELAAAWVRYLPLETLGERVEHRLPFLTGGPQDAPARLRTMWDAIRWSHDLLPAPERTLFRRLAVFPGSCTLDSAEAVAGTEATVVLSGIVSLVDKSLLTLGLDTDGTPRNRMLDTIREFAREELDASGEAAATWRAHADWLLALADQHSLEPFLPDDQAWLNRLETEHANLWEVMAWLDRNGDTQRMAGLAGALGWFWFVRSHFHEGRAALERALAHDDIPAPLRTKMIVVLGLIVVMEGEFPQVAERIARELAAARAARNTPGASQLLILLAATFIVAGGAKLADLPGSRKAVAGFGVPERFAPAAGLALPIAELLIGLALIPTGSARWGALAALVLLAAFIGAIGYNLARGRTPDCHCFGQTHSAPAG